MCLDLSDLATLQHSLGGAKRRRRKGTLAIGIAEATVKVHRCRAMQKMQAASLPELGRLADKLKLLPTGRIAPRAFLSVGDVMPAGADHGSL